jgi:hypothetical protein
MANEEPFIDAAEPLCMDIVLAGTFSMLILPGAMSTEPGEAQPRRRRPAECRWADLCRSTY